MVYYYIDEKFIWGLLVIAILPSFIVAWTIHDHVRNMRYPRLQAFCIRIVLLPPIFSITSWLMMTYLRWAVWPELVRDTYLTYCLYCFWGVMVLWSGGQTRVTQMLAKNEPWLCRCLPHRGDCCLGWTFKTAAGYIKFMRGMMLAAVLCKFIVIFIGAVLESFPQTASQPVRGLFVATFFESISLTMVLTMYFLLKHETLKGLKVSRKFLAMKGIISLTITESMIVSVLLAFDVIPTSEGFTADQHAQELLGIMYVLEMLPLSALLAWLYSRRSMNDGRRVALLEAKNELLSGLNREEGGDRKEALPEPEIQIEPPLMPPGKAILAIFQMWDVCYRSVEEPNGILGMDQESAIQLMIPKGTSSSAPVNSTKTPSVQVMRH